MPIFTNFILAPTADGSLVITLVPPVNITGWTIQFNLMKRFGSTNPIVSKYGASGYTNNQSGITYTSPGAGIFTISLHPSEMSGLDDGNYAYNCLRLDSGAQSILAEGYRIADR